MTNRESPALYPLSTPSPAVTDGQGLEVKDRSREQIESPIERPPLYPSEARKDAERNPRRELLRNTPPNAHDEHHENPSFPAPGVGSPDRLSTPTQPNPTRFPKLSRANDSTTRSTK